jgi:hypothetical protein
MLPRFLPGLLSHPGIDGEDCKDLEDRKNSFKIHKKRACDVTSSLSCQPLNGQVRLR